MPVCKRPNSPHWYTNFRLGGDRYRRSTEVPTSRPRREAQAVEDRLRESAREARARDDSGEITLNDACTRYWSEVAQYQRSGDDVLVMLTRLARSIGKDRLLSEVMDSRIARYVAKRRGHRTRAGGLVSNATVNRDTELLRRVYRRAREVWRRRVAMPNWKAQMLPEAAGRARELTPAEQDALFAAIRPDYRPLIEFALLSGIRLANLIRLTWRQVDFETGIALSVKSRRPGGKPHIVPVTRAMKMLLARQKGGHPIYVFTYECQRSMGPRRKGERYPFSKNGWRHTWKRALADAGIEDFRFHDLRHTAATRVLRRKSNLKVVQRMLGHADIASTARYAHVTPDDVLAAMEASHGHKSMNEPAEEEGENAKKQRP